MINFWWLWVFLKEKTAKDSIRKEQEIMQIESGTSFENEGLVKSTTGGCLENSDLRSKTQKLKPAKCGKLRPPPQKSLTRKLRRTLLSGVHPHRAQF